MGQMFMGRLRVMILESIDAELESIRIHKKRADFQTAHRTVSTGR